MRSAKWSLRFVSIIVLLSFLSGCGGRVANLVSSAQYGDEKKSCESLQFEMSATQDQINRLIPQTKKTGKNVLLGVVGWFLIVPWFFMDLSRAEQEEIDALRLRYNHLVIVATDKGCLEQREQIPDFRDRAAFEAYQKREQEKLTPKPQDAVAAKNMSLDEARAKVKELEAKQNSPKPKNN